MFSVVGVDGQVRGAPTGGPYGFSILVLITVAIQLLAPVLLAAMRAGRR
ncbi:hypothetical protein ABZT16_29460 [Streptomyces flaveolus]|uniref:Uncharacterized protein n=1 Tax=Streptomyces flaveolus TaxID=67297 RepID=A0ABV3AHR9_9ACTN